MIQIQIVEMPLPPAQYNIPLRPRNLKHRRRNLIEFFQSLMAIGPQCIVCKRVKSPEWRRINQPIKSKTCKGVFKYACKDCVDANPEVFKKNMG